MGGAIPPTNPALDESSSIDGVMGGRGWYMAAADPFDPESGCAWDGMSTPCRNLETIMRYLGVSKKLDHTHVQDNFAIVAGRDLTRIRVTKTWRDNKAESGWPEEVLSMLKPKKYALCILLFALLIFPAGGSSAQVHKRLVCGKVILNPTVTFPRTVVMLSLGHESLVPGAVTAEDGTFCVEDHVNDLGDKTAARLYASSFCRLDDVTLVEAPFWPYLRRRKMFSGESILIGPGARTTVGDVNVQIIYGHVTLRILDERLSPLLRGASEWSPVWLRVRDENGVVVHEAGLSMTDIKRSVDLKNSLINLALPQGAWSLEVSLAGVPPGGAVIGRPVSWLQVPGKLRIESCQKPVEASVSVKRKMFS